MQRRRRLEQQLGAADSARAKLTTADVKALVASLKDIVATLADADPSDKAAVYRELGISLTYNNDGRVLVEARPRVVNVRVGGGTRRRGPRLEGPARGVPVSSDDLLLPAAA